MVTEVLFYHLDRMPLERVLPELLEKCLERHWNAVVQVGSEEELVARGLSKDPDALIASGIFQEPIGNEPQLQEMFEQVKAGRYKRTVTMFGENTEEDRAKMREELEEGHSLFQQLISDYRPGLDMECVGTGEHWLGRRGLELGLVDELGTSDDYLLEALDEADLYSVKWASRKTLQEKLTSVVEDGTSAALRGAWQHLRDTRFGAN